MENLFIFLSLNSENLSIWEYYENCFGFPISRGIAFGSLIKNCFLPEKKNAIMGYKPTTDHFPVYTKDLNQNFMAGTIQNVGKKKKKKLWQAQWRWPHINNGWSAGENFKVRNSMSSALSLNRSVLFKWSIVQLTLLLKLSDKWCSGWRQKKIAHI